MRPQVLRTGGPSATALRGWAAVIALAAVVLRLSVHFASGFSVPEAPAPLPEWLRSPDHLWSSPPLPDLALALAHLSPDPATVLIAMELVAVVTVVGLLLRLGERWLDFRVGLLAATGWAFCGPAMAVFRTPGSEGWQAALSILCAAAMLRVARRRAPREAWRIGLSAGLLTLFSGGGLLWALAAIAWLPVTSRRFRGRTWFALAGLVVAGWLAVVLPVVVRNAILSGGELVLPLADLAPAAADWGVRIRGVFALLGGWLPGDEAVARAVPWSVTVLAAWVGVVALLPGTRFLFPLLLGGIVPLAGALMHGVDSGAVVSATPFVCLYAGYGLWRVTTGRRSAITWIALAVVLAIALSVRSVVAGWV